MSERDEQSHEPRTHVPRPTGTLPDTGPFTGPVHEAGKDEVREADETDEIDEVEEADEDEDHPNADIPLPFLDDEEVTAFNREELEEEVNALLDEDRAFDDPAVTCCLRSRHPRHGARRARALLVARDEGILCGVSFAATAFRLLDPAAELRLSVRDREWLAPGMAILEVTGRAAAILAAHRVALHVMGRLSGIATLTRRYVQAVAGTGARVVRALEVLSPQGRVDDYAVTVGGGAWRGEWTELVVRLTPHHLAVLGGDLARALRRADWLAEFDEGQDELVKRLDCRTPAEAGWAAAEWYTVDQIVLRDMTPAELAACVQAVRAVRARLRWASAQTEAVGAFALDDVRAVAETGVDLIAVAGLTGAPPVRMEMEFEVLA